MPPFAFASSWTQIFSIWFAVTLNAAVCELKLSAVEPTLPT
jgi:hypothetical protein